MGGAVERSAHTRRHTRKHGTTARHGSARAGGRAGVRARLHLREQLAVLREGGGGARAAVDGLGFERRGEHLEQRALERAAPRLGHEIGLALGDLAELCRLLLRVARNMRELRRQPADLRLRDREVVLQRRVQRHRLAPLRLGARRRLQLRAQLELELRHVRLEQLRVRLVRLGRCRRRRVGRRGRGRRRRRERRRQRHRRRRVRRRKSGRRKSGRRKSGRRERIGRIPGRCVLLCVR